MLISCSEIIKLKSIPSIYQVSKYNTAKTINIPQMQIDHSNVKPYVGSYIRIGAHIWSERRKSEKIFLHFSFRAITID